MPRKNRVTFDSEFDSRRRKCGHSDNYIDVANVARGSVFDIPFHIYGADVLWVIRQEDADLGDYEETCTEYGVTKDGRWAAVYDGHCSCYGWEAKPEDITYYKDLKLLLAADPKADVILKHAEELKARYPFIKIKV